MCFKNTIKQKKILKEGIKSAKKKEKSTEKLYSS